MTAMKIWLLPEPDSPTTPSVSPRRHVKADALDRMDLAVRRRERDTSRSAHVEQRRSCGHLSGPWVEGVAQAVADEVEAHQGDTMTAAGKISSQGASSMSCAPSAISAPSEASGACTPRPRKDRKLSARITAGMVSVT